MAVTTISYETTPSGGAVKVDTTDEYSALVFVALSSFSDSSVDGAGENFNKQYSIGSSDGTVFGDWTDYTTENIRNFEASNLTEFHVRWRFLLDGADPVSPGVGEEVLVSSLDSVGNTQSFNRSAFSTYFNAGDVRCMNWCINVLEKVYEEGIVPNYMERREGSVTLDIDYIEYWKSVTIFFSYLVVIARTVEGYLDDVEVAKEYLTQFGVQLCGGESLFELQTIARSIFKNFRERGTIESFKKSSERDFIVHGEVLRMICFDDDDDDFFKVSVNRPYDIGWSLNNSSPLYTGTRGVLPLNLGYDDTIGIDEITNYPINFQNATGVSAVVDANTFDGSQNVFEVTPGTGQGGVGSPFYGQANNFAITINPNISYEITAKVKQNSNNRNGLTFGCHALVSGSTSITNNALGDVSNSDTPSDFFFQQAALPIEDQYYLFSGIIFAYGTTITDATHAISGIGQNHLRFLNQDVIKILPFFYTDPDGATDYTLSIYDIKVKPLSLGYSKSFLNQSNFIDIVCTNNNSSLSNDDVDRKLRGSFIPYNTSFKTSYLQ